MATKESLNLAVYAGIKAAILRGDYLPGERLDGRTLESRFEVSSTPVRNALYRLFGEGLIEQNGTDGLFHVPNLSERGVCQLYNAEDDILASCLRASKRLGYGRNNLDLPATIDHDDIVSVTETLFTTIAQASMNYEFARIVSHINDRLRSVRGFEGAGIPNRAQEILDLNSGWAEADYHKLLVRLREYHRVRVTVVRRTITAAERGKKGV